MLGKLKAKIMKELARLMERLGLGGHSQQPQPQSPQQPQSQPQTPSQPAPSGFDPARAHWCYGGENGSRARENVSPSGYRIAKASCDGKTLKFSGSGTMWNCDHDHHDARNCLFFLENGEWYGGFWEWGSADRTSRGLANVFDGYKGWNGQRFMKSPECVFLICNKDCSERSNFVVVKR
jgi:hypothetical protein